MTIISKEEKQIIFTRLTDVNGYADLNLQFSDKQKLQIVIAEEQLKIGRKLNYLIFAMVTFGLINVVPFNLQLWREIIEHHFMKIMNIGSLLNFVGAVLLGLTTQLGSAAGWGGQLNWLTKFWKQINIIGWILLTCGFFIQLVFNN